MRTLMLTLTAAFILSGCTWETYQTDSGKTALRPKYPTGTGIYYTEGAASQNTHYHHGRPRQHAIIPEKNDE